MTNSFHSCEQIQDILCVIMSFWARVMQIAPVTFVAGSISIPITVFDVIGTVACVFGESMKVICF